MVIPSCTKSGNGNVGISSFHPLSRRHPITTNFVAIEGVNCEFVGPLPDVKIFSYLLTDRFCERHLNFVISLKSVHDVFYCPNGILPPGAREGQHLRLGIPRNCHGSESRATLGKSIMASSWSHFRIILPCPNPPTAQFSEQFPSICLAPPLPSRVVTMHR